MTVQSWLLSSVSSKAIDGSDVQPFGYASLRIFLIDSLSNLFLVCVNVLMTLVVNLGSIDVTARPITVRLLRTSVIC